MSVDITTTSHYLHESQRINKQELHVNWIDKDANYNIRLGLMFGESETDTLELQGWKDKS